MTNAFCAVPETYIFGNGDERVRAGEKHLENER